MRKQLTAAVAAIDASHKIVLAGHVNPDGDTLGCVLALAHVLRRAGKDVTAISTDGVPAIYRWMPGTDRIVTGTDRRDFDLAIVCDAGALERIGRSVVPAIESAPLVIDIDHHVADGVFGDIRILDVTAAATAELVWLLVLALGKLWGRDLADKAIAD